MPTSKFPRSPPSLALSINFVSESIDPILALSNLLLTFSAKELPFFLTADTLFPALSFFEYLATSLKDSLKISSNSV